MHPPRRRGGHLPLLSALLLSWGCGTPAVKPDPQPSVAPAQPGTALPPPADGETEHDGMQIEGTLGALDEDAVQAGLAPKLAELSGCFSKQLQQEPYLGGELTLHFRIALDGTVKQVRLSQSSVGSLAVERCARAGAARCRFARPRGGEAEFTYPMTFQDRSPVQNWDPGMVKQEILDHLDVLLAGQSTSAPPLQAPAGLIVTFYVNGRGKVISVGMAAEGTVPDEFADAFARNLKQLKFEAASAGFHAAKVSYTW